MQADRRERHIDDRTGQHGPAAIVDDDATVPGSELPDAAIGNFDRGSGVYNSTVLYTVDMANHTAGRYQEWALWGWC
jgi:hypothetical protein